MNWSYRWDRSCSSRSHCQIQCWSIHFDIHYNCDRWHWVYNGKCRWSGHISTRRIRFARYPVGSRSIARSCHVARPTDRRSVLASRIHSSVRLCCGYISSIRRWCGCSCLQHSDRRCCYSHTTDTAGLCPRGQLDRRNSHRNKVHNESL